MYHLKWHKNMYFDNTLHLCVSYYCQNKFRFLSLNDIKLSDFVSEAGCVLWDLGDKFYASLRWISVFKRLIIYVFLSVILEVLRFHFRMKHNCLIQFVSVSLPCRVRGYLSKVKTFSISAYAVCTYTLRLFRNQTRTNTYSNLKAVLNEFALQF
jgi:hypothetical protein